MACERTRVELRGRWTAVARAASLITIIAGCSESTAPPTPTAPSGPRAELADFTGEWIGLIEPGLNGVCYAIGWNPVPGASNAAGVYRIGPKDRGEPWNPIRGTMTATPSGASFSLIINIPSGASSNPACSMNGSGNTNAGQTEMSGSVTLEWTPACTGHIYASNFPATQRGTLTLRKGASLPDGC
jgi:hypothetical protein